ncbi:MAG: hypothetical protein GY854_24300 [Deltaproteobacteria bacterium]|nr:hypothetical protein [Deltaproteobacteria bacterium]
MKNVSRTILAFVLAYLIMGGNARAQNTETGDQVILGLKVSAGGRYDDVRMCVGSPKGVKGGPALDVSFFIETGVSQRMSVSINVPVMRPILFGAAFKMLQFEPEATLIFRVPRDGNFDVVVGPSLGVTLHYGPDYQSGRSGEERGPSFFALGPRIGGYLGLDFKRPGETFNFQLGLRPYVTPLFSIDSPEDHRGVVVGGLMDGQFRFSLK